MRLLTPMVRWLKRGFNKVAHKLNPYSNQLDALEEKNKVLQAEFGEALKTVYDLQLADPHLEFISQVQDAGLHEEWNEFLDLLKAAQEAGE
jgi:hypothetical protein